MKIAKQALILITAALIVIFPDTAQNSIREAIDFVVKSVVPSLFSFMVMSKIIVNSGTASFIAPIFKPVSRLLHFSKKETACFIVGNLCGFPSGAAISSDISINNKLDRIRATTLSVASNNVSPAFMISFVGAGLFSSRIIGFIIYISQLISCVMICAVLRRKITVEDFCNEDKNKSQSFVNIFCKAVSDSAVSSIALSAYIIVFSVISSYITIFIKYINAPEILNVFIRSVLEVSSGCSSAVGLPFLISVAVIAFSCGFSGLSVIFQSASYLNVAEIKIKDFIIIKIVQGIVASVISAAALYFTSISAGITKSVFSYDIKMHYMYIVAVTLLAAYLFLQIKRIAEIKFSS